MGPALGHENRRDRPLVGCVRAQPVDGLRGKCHQAAVAQDFGGGWIAAGSAARKFAALMR